MTNANPTERTHVRAMALEIIPSAEGTRLLYAAQVAHMALTKRPKSAANRPIQAPPQPTQLQKNQQHNRHFQRKNSTPPVFQAFVGLNCRPEPQFLRPRLGRGIEIWATPRGLSLKVICEAIRSAECWIKLTSWSVLRIALNESLVSSLHSPD